MRPVWNKLLIYIFRFYIFRFSIFRFSNFRFSDIRFSDFRFTYFRFSDFRFSDFQIKSWLWWKTVFGIFLFNYKSFGNSFWPIYIESWELFRMSHLSASESLWLQRNRISKFLRQKLVFARARATSGENQKSKENHIRGIQRAFEWAIGRLLISYGRGETRVHKIRGKKKEEEKNTHNYIRILIY